MSQALMELAEKPSRKSELPQFDVGNTVDVYLRIVEGAKERVQVFNGVVIAKRGHGMNKMFTVRRIVANQGVERTFMSHSPFVVDVKVRRRGKVRRAKLYYLRDRVGKARRLREVRVSSSKSSSKGQAGASAKGSPAEQLATAAV